MKLAPKLLMPIFLIALTTPALMLVSAWLNRSVADAHLEAVSTRQLALSAAEIRSLSRAIQRDAFKVIISPLSPGAKEARKSIERNAPEMLALASALGKSLHWLEAEKAQRLSPLKTELVAAIAEADQASIDVGRDVAMKIFRERVEPAEKASSDLIDELVKRIDERAQRTEQVAIAAEQTTTKQLLWSALAAMVATLGLTFHTVLSHVVRPLKRLCDAIVSLQARQYDVDVPFMARRDELGAIAVAVDHFRIDLLAGARAAIEQERIRTETVAERHANEAERADAARKAGETVIALGRSLGRLAEGDLTARIAVALPPEYAKLRVDFNGAVTTLEETLGTIAGSGRAMHDGSDEISQALNDLSQRTEQQAAGLEETSAALQEITHKVRITAASVQSARATAENAKAEAEASGAAVLDAVAAMDRIEQSSTEIGNVSDVIDAIAFQTSLLALNAGVEAARAGDSGRGFAIVAAEVRNLAQSSADAARQIKQLIGASTSEIRAGASLVRETGRVPKRILRQSGEMNEIMSNIASAAQEQATSLAEVSSTMGRIDQITTQNAAMVEQSTAASRALAAEAERLRLLLGRFTLSQERLAA